MKQVVDNSAAPSDKGSPKLDSRSGSTDGLPTLTDTDQKPKAYVRQNAGVTKIEALCGSNSLLTMSPSTDRVKTLSSVKDGSCGCSGSRLVSSPTSTRTSDW